MYSRNFLIPRITSASLVWCLQAILISFQVIAGFLIRHMKPFSEESLPSFTESTQTFEYFARKRKTLISPHSAKVFHVTPHPIKTLYCQLKFPYHPTLPPPSAPPGTKHKQGCLRQTVAQLFKYPLTLWLGSSAERASWQFAALTILSL